MSEEARVSSLTNEIRPVYGMEETQPLTRRNPSPNRPDLEQSDDQDGPKEAQSHLNGISRLILRGMDIY